MKPNKTNKGKIEQCFCKSYYDDDNVLQDCTCGKCGGDRSYTCCNIEVHEPAGTEVMCPDCKEYCTTEPEE